MTHKDKILEILWDLRPHSNFEIHERTGILRYSARIMEMRRQGYDIITTRDREDPQLHWFHLKNRLPIPAKNPGPSPSSPKENAPGPVRSSRTQESFKKSKECDHQYLERLSTVSPQYVKVKCLNCKQETLEKIRS